jgi:hypothetical protein
VRFLNVEMAKSTYQYVFQYRTRAICVCGDRDSRLPRTEVDRTKLVPHVCVRVQGVGFSVELCARAARSATNPVPPTSWHNRGWGERESGGGGGATRGDAGVLVIIKASPAKATGNGVFKPPWREDGGSRHSKSDAVMQCIRVSLRRP